MGRRGDVSTGARLDVRIAAALPFRNRGSNMAKPIRDIGISGRAKVLGCGHGGCLGVCSRQCPAALLRLEIPFSIRRFRVLLSCWLSRALNDSVAGLAGKKEEPETF